MKKQIIRRPVVGSTHLVSLSPLLQHLYSTRGVQSLDELERGLEKLAPFDTLTNIESAVDCLVNALEQKLHIMIVGDFDADGATSTALAVECLRQMGANKVSFLVPNRFEYGYGLTPEIVDVAAKSNPELLITVDNGISSHDGVKRAHELGIKVVITDHHLPATTLPQAEAIINPNLKNDLFPSKNLAGVGVIFYVLMALRARLRTLNWFRCQNISEVNMASFLDLVALGTIADVVPLDSNNRILVHQGLTRIRAGKVRPGIKALLEVGGKKIDTISVSDLGFIVAPRLNAAGRLVDMRLGIDCLLANEDHALTYAAELNSLNRERQQIEEGMREQALATIKDLELHENLPQGVCLLDPTWHQGIVGIVASRIKDLINRPVIAFALINDEELKGSGRSIQGLHLRDVLEKIANEYPGLITKFGGHAMAAGMSLPRQNFERFAGLFNDTVSASLPSDKFEGILHSDGELTSKNLTLETAEIIQKAGPWGQGFPEPLFDGQFKVISYRILKEKHLKLVLSNLEDFFMVDAIAFNVEPKKINFQENTHLHIAYRLDINEYKGNRNLQLMIEYFDVL